MKVLSIFHGCVLLGYLIANMCECMWKANVREHQRGNNKMDNQQKLTTLGTQDT